MNGSVGMDLAEISRIRKAMENPRFLLEFFTENERAYITARHTPEQSAAGAWGRQGSLFQGGGHRCAGLVAPGGGSAATIHWGSRFSGCMDGRTAVFRLCVFTEHQPTVPWAAAVVLAEKQGGK